jgi:hypothetical protein
LLVHLCAEFKARLEPLIGLALDLDPPVKDDPLEVGTQKEQEVVSECAFSLKPSRRADDAS